MSVKKKIAAATGILICLIVFAAAGYAAGYWHGVTGKAIFSSSKDKQQSTALEDGEIDEDEIEPLEEDKISVLCCGVDNTQELTDVIMYAVFDTKDKSVDILRIPRDTFVGSDFPTGKINSIYGHPYEGMSGIETLKKYLEDNWKLNIDYYATINLESVREIVDDMGGVTMNIEQEIDYLPGKVLYPGEQTLTGEQAEWIIRYRAGYADGDLGRIDAQTQFLMACIDRVHELGRLQCIPILMKHYDDVETDMPLDKMISVASALFELDTNDMEMHVVPGQGTMYYSYAVYAVDKPELLEMLNENFFNDGDEMEMEDLSGIPDLLGTSSNYNSGYGNSSNGYNNNYNNNYNNDYSNNQSEDTTQQDSSQWEPQYQYDEDGNPLYRLDENGDPIYDYDEDGNVVYIYEQQNPDQSTEQPDQSGQQEQSSEEEQPEEEQPPKEEEDSGRKVLSRLN